MRLYWRHEISPSVYSNVHTDIKCARLKEEESHKKKEKKTERKKERKKESGPKGTKIEGASYRF